MEYLNQEKSRNVASFLYSEIMENLYCHTENAFKRDKNEEMWLCFYVEYKIEVCIIDTIPHCHAEMLSKGAKSRIVASFLYSGTMEYVSSIVFHTVILNKLSKEAKSRNVASLLYRGQSWSMYHR